MKKILILLFVTISANCFSQAKTEYDLRIKAAKYKDMSAIAAGGALTSQLYKWITVQTHERAIEDKQDKLLKNPGQSISYLQQEINDLNKKIRNTNRICDITSIGLGLASVTLFACGVDLDRKALRLSKSTTLAVRPTGNGVSLALNF